MLGCYGCILVRLLRVYFPRNWEFGSAVSKLGNFGGFETPTAFPRYATDDYDDDDYDNNNNNYYYYLTTAIEMAKTQ